MAPRRRPLGLLALTFFFAAGSAVCLLIVLALLFPGGSLDSIWRLKPQAKMEFEQIGAWSVVLMSVVGVACGLAAFGLGRNVEWGRKLAIGILGVNLIGDTVSAIVRHDPITLIGLPVGGLLIVYLFRKGSLRQD